ncbi:MAG: alpha/beta fold hydrolase [Clostridia bacterium]|nr:alpha/beta fold hydrolase [Clostridia bacterium]
MHDAEGCDIIHRERKLGINGNESRPMRALHEKRKKKGNVRELTEMKTKSFSIHEPPINIRCLMYSGDSAVKRAVVYCHGFAGNKGTRSAARFAEYMLPKYKDMAVLCFDWPCHGEDVRKKLCLADCDAYLAAVVRCARETLRADEIDCYASSFGGYLALRYIRENGDPFRLIALRSPAVNMYEVLDSMLTDADRAQIARGKDAPVGFERKIAVGRAFLGELKAADIMAADYSAEAGSILIMHGEKDEVVPFAAAKAFAEKNGIDFIPFPSADHRFSDPKLMTEAIQYVEAFFAY